MGTSKKLAEELLAGLKELEKEDPRVIFQRMVDSGLITPEGRLSNRYRGPGKYVRYTIEEEDEMLREGALQINEGD